MFFTTVLFNSEISSTLLSASTVTVSVFAPLSVIGFIGTEIFIESAYFIAGTTLLYKIIKESFGSFLLTELRIESSIALPMFSILILTWKELSATEIIEGLTLTI